LDILQSSRSEKTFVGNALAGSMNNIITIYETENCADWSRTEMPWINPAKEKEFRIRHAYYMAVLRFILTDPAQRRFTAQRYCFRGSVDDWIGLGPSAPLSGLLKQYVKHLGRDSFYELF
jgi:hypothetical protein